MISPNFYSFCSGRQTWSEVTALNLDWRQPDCDQWIRTAQLGDRRTPREQIVPAQCGLMHGGRYGLPTVGTVIFARLESATRTKTNSYSRPRIGGRTPHSAEGPFNLARLRYRPLGPESRVPKPNLRRDRLTRLIVSRVIDGGPQCRNVRYHMH
jgi:hypothetical protein